MKKIILTSIFLVIIGISSIVKAQFTVYNTSNSNIPNNSITGGIALDKNNNIWIGTQGSGVVKFDGTNWTQYNMSNSGLPSDVISCLASDTINNCIWVGTVGDGVAKFDGNVWTTYTYSDGLCDNGIYSIAIDKNGDVWFASWGAGVSKFNGSIWTTYISELPNDEGVVASVYYILVDNSNVKWFGTSLGLVKYDGTNFTTINQTTIPELKSNYINAVAVDLDNNVWLGVGSNGITKLSSTLAWIENDTAGFCDKTIRDIKIDSKGFVWTGQHTIYGSKIVGGITKFNPTTKQAVSYASTDSTGEYLDQVFNILIDNNENIWICTGNNGLYKFHAPDGINELYTYKPFSVFPCPVVDILNINLNIQSGLIKILDISGREMFTKGFSSSVDVEYLEKGIYLISITENNTVYQSKFIKE